MSSQPPSHTAPASSPPDERVRVWLRPTGVRCKVRVEGPAAAYRLRERIASLTTCGPIRSVAGTAFVVFDVELGAGFTHADLQCALERLPGAQVMLEPA